MIKKREKCKYCGEKMKSVTAKKEFCSNKCKVYYWRENKFKAVVPVKVSTKRLVTPVKPVDLSDDPMPLRTNFTDNWTYLTEKSAWKDRQELKNKK